MDNTPRSPKQALLLSRIIWAALLMGQIMFLVVILVMRQGGEDQPKPQPILGYVAIGMALMAVPPAFFLRKVTFGKLDDDGHVAPGKFTSGNILFLALLEGASFFGLVVFFLGDPIGIVASMGLMAVQVVNFPTGRLLGDTTA